MDPVTKPDRRAALRAKLDGTLEKMRRAASAAILRGDPLAEQMTALALSVEALGEICDASAATQLDIEERLRGQGEAVVDGAIERVDAVGIGMIDKLTPRLVALLERSCRQRLRVWRLRSILGSAAIALLALTVSGGYVYAIGYTAGRSNGELIGHTIAVAMAVGPDAAADWASLMAVNDPRQALASCKKSLATDQRGRRYCQMPVWLDRPPAPRSGS